MLLPTCIIYNYKYCCLKLICYYSVFVLLFYSSFKVINNSPLLLQSHTWGILFTTRDVLDINHKLWNMWQEVTMAGFWGGFLLSLYQRDYLWREKADVATYFFNTKP